MNDQTPPGDDAAALRAQVQELRAAVLEIAITQAEALQAVRILARAVKPPFTFAAGMDRSGNADGPNRLMLRRADRLAQDSAARLLDLAQKIGGLEAGDDR